MPAPDSIVRSTRWPLALVAQWLGAIVSAAVSVALMVWLARAMDAHEFVRYSSALSAALVALALIEGGWSALIYREHSGRRDFGSLAGLRATALAHAFFVALLSAFALWGVTREPRLAVAAALCMLTVALMNHRSVLLRSQQRFGAEAGWQVLGRMLSALAITGAVLHIRAVADWVFFAWAGALGLILVVSVRRWATAPSWADAKRWYPQALLILVADACFVALLKGDLVWLSTSAQWGVPAASDSVLKNYAVCVRWVEGALLLVAPLSNVVVARLRTHRLDAEAKATMATNDARFAESKQAFRWVFIGAGICAAFGALCWVAAWAGGEEVVTAAFGTAYVGAGAWMSIVALPLPMACANLVLFQAVLAVASGSELARAAAAGLLSFVVAATLLLFMKYGAVGVAIAAAVGQSVLLFSLVKIFNSHRLASRSIETL